MTEAELFSLLDDPSRGALVLTSNARAARALRTRHSLWQQRKNKAAWHTPQIQLWEAWLAEIWNELLLSGAVQHILLSPAQERQLWKETILSEGNTENDPIWYSDSLAELAQTSQELLESYDIAAQPLEQAAGKDARTFLLWLRAFRNQCAKRGFLYRAALSRYVAEKLHAMPMQLPREIFLIGFDRVMPRQQSLLEQLQTTGCAHSFLWLTMEEAAKPTPALIAADTLEEELTAAACWIRKRLTENPNQRIGILAPSITKSRNSIDRIFRTVLAPSTLNLHAGVQHLPYEFSLGVPLHQVPQVQIAIKLLRWLIRPIAFDQASSLFVSTHMGGDAADARARLDAAIRKNPKFLDGEPDFTWLIHRLRETTDPELAALRKCMEQIAGLAKEAFLLAGGSSRSKRRTHTEWRELIDQLLQAANWSVLQVKDSVAFQLLERWNGLLDQLSMLDAITSAVTFPEMLETLEVAASQTLYAPETHNAPVQIMGIPESAGLTFDAVWFLQASANAWPPRGHAQPWIPWQIQRAAEMPYANVQADYQHARKVTERILAACGESVFSFSLEDNAEDISTARKPSIAVRTSPILQDMFPLQLPLKAQEWLPEIRTYGNLQEACETVSLESELSVPFKNAKVQRGVNFLKQQAACPFKAFAELRLSATATEEPSVGLAANVQGNVLHEVLRTFWAEIKNQVTLRTLPQEKRIEILDAHIHQALHALPAGSALEKALLSIEAERLRSRLLSWLEIEEQRSDFSVLEGEKSLQEAWIGDVQFDCRIDRIDTTDNGLALIDYKTGAVKASACDGERPDEPQLPAYAVLLRDQISPNQPLGGVAIASLQAKQVEFTIIRSLPHTFSPSDPRNTKLRTPILNTEEEFLAQVDVWEQTLRRLADDFRAGVAAVDPKIPGITCRYCEQSIFCRIVETQLVTEEADQEDDSEHNPATQDS